MDVLDERMGISPQTEDSSRYKFFSKIHFYVKSHAIFVKLCFGVIRTLNIKFKASNSKVLWLSGGFGDLGLF